MGAIKVLHFVVGFPGCFEKESNTTFCSINSLLEPYIKQETYSTYCIEQQIHANECVVNRQYRSISLILMWLRIIGNVAYTLRKKHMK